MIQWIVGNMHVGTSDTGIVREFYRRFRESYRQGRATSRAERKRCYRLGLKAHHANQAIVREFRL